MANNHILGSGLAGLPMVIVGKPLTYNGVIYPVGAEFDDPSFPVRVMQLYKQRRIGPKPATPDSLSAPNPDTQLGSSETKSKPVDPVSPDSGAAGSQLKDSQPKVYVPGKRRAG